MVRSLWGPGLLLGAFVLLALGAATSPYFAAVDLPLERFVQTATPRLLGLIFEALTALGQRMPMALLIVVSAALLWWSRLRLEGALVAGTLIPAFLNSVMKSLVDRPRPDAGLVRVIEQASSMLETSFPSGHATQFTVVFGLLAYFASVRLQGRMRRWAVGALLALIVLVGPARVYMGAHWPSDVLGGYLFGGLSLWLMVRLYREMLTRRERDPAALVREAEAPRSGPSEGQTADRS
ncbi:MAG: phosphatase PAP2 family protein [Chloroflexi bacterium]|nr:phosphatase PAP2 family protein [Chloroflexota bacterium]